MARRTSRGLAAAATATVALLPLTGPAGSASASGSAPAAPQARVFMVNPVQSSGDQPLTDAKDAAGAVPASAYATAALRNLDASGGLSGTWALVRSDTGASAKTTDAGSYTGTTTSSSRSWPTSG